MHRNCVRGMDPEECEVLYGRAGSVVPAVCCQTHRSGPRQGNCSGVVSGHPNYLCNVHGLAWLATNCS
jgi:hypothetical protein